MTATRFSTLALTLAIALIAAAGTLGSTLALLTA